MAIPANVKKQLEEANRLQSQIANPAADEAIPAEGEQTEQEEAVAQGHPPKTEQRQEEKGAEYWQQRFNVIDGKYRAEVPRLTAQVSELTNQVQQLSQELEQAKTAPAHEQSTTQFDANFLTDDEKEEYGELAEVIARVAQRVADARTKTVAERVDQFDSQFKQTQAQTAQERLFSALDAQVPGWREIDQDPAFHAFLGESDPYAGVPRQELLMDAYRKGDASRIARFYADFTGHQPPKAAQGKRPDPASKVVPDSRSAGNAPVGGKTYTTAQINEFYKNKSMGKFVGREAEARAIEQDIIAASSEGRVIA